MECVGASAVARPMMGPILFSIGRRSRRDTIATLITLQGSFPAPCPITILVPFNFALGICSKPIRILAALARRQRIDLVLLLPHCSYLFLRDIQCAVFGSARPGRADFLRRSFDGTSAYLLCQFGKRGINRRHRSEKEHG